MKNDEDIELIRLIINNHNKIECFDLIDIESMQNAK